MIPQRGRKHNGCEYFSFLWPHHATMGPIGGSITYRVFMESSSWSLPTCVGLTKLSTEGKSFDVYLVSSFELFTPFYNTMIIFW